MKRLLAGSVAAMMLVASQASAVAPTLTNLGGADRAAATSQTANEYFGLSPLVLALIAAGLIAIIWVVVDDDDPSSP